MYYNLECFFLLNNTLCVKHLNHIFNIYKLEAQVSLYRSPDINNSS